MLWPVFEWPLAGPMSWPVFEWPVGCGRFLVGTGKGSRVGRGTIKAESSQFFRVNLPFLILRSARAEQFTRRNC